MTIDPLKVPVGISITAIKILCLCSKSSQDGTAISRSLGLSAGTISTTTYGMERKGLIKRRTHRDDRRRQMFSITSAGREVLAQCESSEIALPA